MLRIFTGLPLPANVKHQLGAVMHGVPGARWQTDEQLHLTLRFIGEVDEPSAQDIDVALSALRFKPFTLHLNGVGLFGPIRRPRVLWAGVEPAGPVSSLKQKIDAALEALSLAPDTRKYTPHVTLTRFKNRPERLDRFLDANAGLTSASWPVDQFVLYRSHLGQAGAHYETLATYEAAT